MDFPSVGFIRRRAVIFDLDTVSRLFHWLTPELLHNPTGSRSSCETAYEQKRAAPTSGPVEATCCEAMKSLLLLALVVSLRRMVVSCFGFISCLSRLLLGTHMIVAAVLLRGSPMSLRSLLMMFGSLFVHILRHNISLLF